MSQNNSIATGDSADKPKTIDGAFNSINACVSTVEAVKNHRSGKQDPYPVCPVTFEDVSSDEESRDDAMRMGRRYNAAMATISSLQGGDGDNRVAATTSTAQKKENKKRTLDQFTADPEFQAEVKACEDTFKKAKREKKEIDALAERIAELERILAATKGCLCYNAGSMIVAEVKAIIKNEN